MEVIDYIYIYFVIGKFGLSVMSYIVGINDSFFSQNALTSIYCVRFGRRTDTVRIMQGTCTDSAPGPATLVEAERVCVIQNEY